MLLKVNKYSLYVSSRTTSLVPSTKDMVAELLAVCVLINIKLPNPVMLPNSVAFFTPLLFNWNLRIID